MRRRHHYATTGNRAFVSVSAELDTDGEVFVRDPALGPAPIGAIATADHGRHRTRRG